MTQATRVAVLFATTGTASGLASTAQAQTITTSPLLAEPVSVAATPVPLGHPLTWLLLGLVLVLSLPWLLRRMGVQPGHLRQVALGGAMVVLGASAFWGDAVRAQLQLLQVAFTQASGETLAIPLQAVETAGVVTGFVPVEFANTTPVPLQIQGIAAPAGTACFPAGVPATPVVTASVPTSAPCTIGQTVAAGQACWVNTAALCAAAANALQGAAPSVLLDDSVTVNEGGSASGNVLANDSDADGPLRLASYTLGGNRYLAGQSAGVSGLGTVVLQADGSYQVVAALPGAGLATALQYTTQTGAVAVLTIRTNRTPRAVEDSATIAQNKFATVPVLTNDSDADGDALQIASYTQGSHGSVAPDGPDRLRYTPSAQYLGADSFSYTVSDGNGLTANAVVQIMVTAVNGSPVAVADRASVEQASSVTIPVRANDTDVDGDLLTVSGVTQGAHGSVTIDPVTGNPVYIPNAGYWGTDQFTYTVMDPAGATATGTVTVTVIARNGVCGDGFTDIAEQCDDGNGINGDGCSNTCTWESLPVRAAVATTPTQALRLAPTTQRARIALP